MYVMPIIRSGTIFYDRIKQITVFENENSSELTNAEIGDAATIEIKKNRSTVIPQQYHKNTEEDRKYLNSNLPFC